MATCLAEFVSCLQVVSVRQEPESPRVGTTLRKASTEQRKQSLYHPACTVDAASLAISQNCGFISSEISSEKEHWTSLGGRKQTYRWNYRSAQTLKLLKCSMLKIVT